MSFRNFTTGTGHSSGGEHLELVPGERLRDTDTFDDPNLAGDIEITVALKPVSCGTDLTNVQSGLPDVIPWKPATSAGRNRRKTSPASSSRRSISRAIAVGRCKHTGLLIRLRA